MSAKRIKPKSAVTASVTLVARRRISPSFIRLTLTGHELDTYQSLGADQWFRLFLPTEGVESTGTPRTLPDMSVRSMATYTLTPPSRRPLIRNYTTAGFRPADPDAGRPAELDFDVYTDESHSGPGLRWALDAAPGTPAALLDEGCLYAPPENSTTELLVGDESALPAIAGILRDAPDTLTGLAVIEVGDDLDVRDLTAPAGVETVWVVRRDEAPGSVAAAEVQRRGVPATLTYAYLAGPASLATGLRRFLVRENGVDKQRVSFTGYWR